MTGNPYAPEPTKQAGMADWRDDAACLGVPTELFYARRPGEVTLKKVKAICDSCPVREICLDTAMAEERRVGTGEPFGYRGGKSARERNILAAERRAVRSHERPVLGACVDCGTTFTRRRSAPKTIRCGPCTTAHRVAYDREYKAEWARTHRRRRTNQENGSHTAAARKRRKEEHTPREGETA